LPAVYEGKAFGSGKSMGSATERGPARITGIDLMRVFAIMGVILLHTNPFVGPYFASDRLLTSASILINSLSRFAVPFFFVTSGYFFGLRLGKGADAVALLRRRAVRLVALFVAVSVFYAVVNSIVLNIPAQRIFYSVVKNPLIFIANGTELHLWFLPALVAGLCVPVVFITLRIERYYTAFAALVFVFGLAAGPYHDVFGIDMAINTRNGLFFSTLFVAVGVWASKRRRLPGPWLSTGIILAGLAMQLFEGYLLLRNYGASMISHDFLLGTLLLGSGPFFLAMNLKSSVFSGAIERLGRLTLGVYLFHVVMVRLAYHLLLASGLSVFASQFVFPVLVYVFSVVVTYPFQLLLAGFGGGRSRSV